MNLGPVKKAVFVVTLFLLGVCPVLGKGPQDVSKTIHNLSTTPHDDNWDEDLFYKSRYEQYSTQYNEVCVFCHTPHGGSKTGPLWNRVDPGQSSWTHYNSASLSGYLKGLDATRAVNDESLMCLSCHDGSIATNRVLNPSNQTNAQPINWATLGSEDTFIFGAPVGSSNRIGGNPGAFDESGTGQLQDDHPISFSYDSSYASLGGNGLHTVVDAQNQGIRFFGGTGVNRVECSSCHDPHVNYDPNVPPGDLTYDASYAPFLVTSNAGSAMCLACHDK